MFLDCVSSNLLLSTYYTVIKPHHLNLCIVAFPEILVKAKCGSNNTVFLDGTRQVISKISPSTVVPKLFNYTFRLSLIIVLNCATKMPALYQRLEVPTKLLFLFLTTEALSQRRLTSIFGSLWLLPAGKHC